VVTTSTSLNPPVIGNRLSRELIEDLSSYAADLYVSRKCRVAPDGTRLPEGSESPKSLHRTSHSTLVTQTNIGDQKQPPVVVVADPILESIRVH
jgi:hypothetical protein